MGGGRVGAGRIREADLAIRIVGTREGRALNRHYRGKGLRHQRAQFPRNCPKARPRASAIAGRPGHLRPVVAREARKQRKPLAAHYAHLTVHGALHLLGWDHEDPREADCMEQLEREILPDWAPDPYQPAVAAAVHRPATRLR